MGLLRHLAEDLAERHPDEAAAALEGLPAAEAAALLDELPVAHAARVLQRTTSHPAAAMLASLARPRAASLVAALPVEVAAGYLRRLDAKERQAILQELPRSRAHSLQALLRFRENTAGALMDPEVLALPEDLTVAEAAERVRSSAEHARYNLYVVDRNDRLVGVLNLRELLLAPTEQSVAEVMHRNVIRVPAESDWRALVDHPGWREVHALPVVDETGSYLGAVRYRTLRRLEAQRRAPATARGATAQALGELFQAGISGVVEALAAGSPRSSGRSPE